MPFNLRFAGFLGKLGMTNRYGNRSIQGIPRRITLPLIVRVCIMPSEWRGNAGLLVWFRQSLRYFPAKCRLPYATRGGFSAVVFLYKIRARTLRLERHPRSEAKPKRGIPGGKQITINLKRTIPIIETRNPIAFYIHKGFLRYFLYRII